MAFWSRLGNSQLKLFRTQFRSSYSKRRPTSFLTQVSRNPHLEIPKLPSEFFQHSNVRFFAAPVQVKPKEEKTEKGPRLNEKIPHRIIRLVEQNEEHCVLSRTVALERAKRLNLDLVEVDRHADPPVCRLMDYHKERYVKQVKEKERAKSKVTVKNTCKEVRFSPKCEQKDLVVKANTAKRLMESGYRVKCMALGNEDQDLAELLSRFTPLIEDVSVIESGPIVEKKQAYVLVRHTKFGLKGGKKASKFTGDKTNEAPKATSPKQTPMQFDEHIHPVESKGESDNQVLSDEDDISFASVHRRERTPSVVSGSSDDFERVYTDDENEAIQSISYKETKPIDTDQGRFGSPSPPQSQPRHTMNTFPSRLEGSLLKNTSPNEVPKQEQPCPNPAKPTPSYGIFSGLGAGNPSRQQVLGTGMNADRNRSPVDYTAPTSEGASVDKARLGPLPPPQAQPRHNMNAYPSRPGGPALQSVNVSSNEVPSQEKPCTDSPKSTPSYGIFSGLGASNPSRQQGLGTGMNANMNSNPVDFRTAPTSEGVSIDKARLGPQSPPQPQSQHKMNVPPSRPERPVFKSVNASPNVVPEQEKSNPPKATLSYGIFSGLGSSNTSQQQQGLGTGMSANMNRNAVDSETRPRCAGPPVDQARLGHQSPLQSEPRYNLKPLRTDGLVFNNSKGSPNEVTGQKQQLSDPPKPTPAYGIFSGMKTSNPGKQGLGSEVNASLKGNPVDSQPLPKSKESDLFVSQPDGGQKPSNQGGFGIFSRDSG